MGQLSLVRSLRKSKEAEIAICVSTMLTCTLPPIDARRAVIYPSCTSNSIVPGRYCTLSFSASGAMAMAACRVRSSLRVRV